MGLCFLDYIPPDGVKYYDTKRNKNVIHTLIADRPFNAKSQNASNLTKITIQKCQNGAIIDGTPYAFKRKAINVIDSGKIQNFPIYQRIANIQTDFRECVEQWESQVMANWTNCDNLFLSSADLALIKKMMKEVDELIKTTEVKLNNIVMMMK